MKHSHQRETNPSLLPSFGGWVCNTDNCGRAWFCNHGENSSSGVQLCGWWASTDDGGVLQCTYATSWICRSGCDGCIARGSKVSVIFCPLDWCFHRHHVKSASREMQRKHDPLTGNCFTHSQLLQWVCSPADSEACGPLRTGWDVSLDRSCSLFECTWWSFLLK